MATESSEAADPPTSSVEIEMTEPDAQKAESDDKDVDTDPEADGQTDEGSPKDEGDDKADAKESAKVGDDDKCEWNYINVIIAVFCGIIVVGLLALMIWYLVLNTGEVRTYYLAIEEVEWSYAPGDNLCGSQFDETFAQFNSTSSSRIGATYRKARYVQYTDNTFTNKTAASASDEHLGILGPVLRATVGETLRVFVRNDASFPFSVNPWGLRIAKASEGAGYDDRSFFFDKYEDAVAPLAINQFTCTGFGINVQTGCRPFLVHPGQFIMQDWPVTADAGPQDGDGTSVMWLYTSDVDGQIEPGIHAGLIGAIIVDDGSEATAPDFEFVNVFLHSDENKSPYLDTNMWDKLVKGNYGDVIKGWVPFGFLDQVEVLRSLYLHAAGGDGKDGVVDQLPYDTAATLVAESVANRQAVETVNGVYINVQFTDPDVNAVDSNSFDPVAYNGRYGDGAAQKVVHGLFIKALDELKNDESFMESNRVQTINGLAYCNQEGLVVDVPDGGHGLAAHSIVRWYTSAVGGTDSIHVPSWTGNPAAGADAQVIAGSTSVMDIEVRDMQPGNWAFEDALLDHALAGARSNYTVLRADGEESADFVAALSSGADVQSYYLKAVELEWDYLPSASFGQAEGTSACADGLGTQASSQFLSSKLSIGSTYTKWQFQQCADETCTTTLDADPSNGLMGPVLRVEEGQQLEVTLFNEVSEDVTLRVDGLLGVQAQGELAVAPGSSETFVWFAPTSASLDSDADSETTNSRAFAYYSDSLSHINAGLMGAVVVIDDGEAVTSDSGVPLLPKGVDEEFVLFFGTFDENESPLALQNAMSGLSELGLDSDGLADVMTTNTDFRAANRMPSINGRAYCTLEGLEVAKGSSVRFHLLAPRTNEVVHSGAMLGHNLALSSHRVQTATLFPGSSASFTVTAQPGNWEVFDGAAEFFNAGVRAPFIVDGVVSAEDLGTETKQTRTFYIAADEVEWDYAPHGYNVCQFSKFENDEDSAKYMVQGEHRIGSKYVKAQYRRYTDDTFEYLQSGTISRANTASHHLGLLGTVITVQVGDTLVVHFKNKLRYPANFVLPGPFQSRAQKADGESDLDAMVVLQPGETKTYTWVVTEEMGPAVADANAIAWTYSPRVNDGAVEGVTSEALMHAGLVGAVIVVREGEMKSSQTMPVGVDLEFIILTGTLDENLSPYLRLNAQRYADNAFSIDYDDPDFQESNRMRSLNGFMYCNGQGWSGNLYSHARFYILGTDSGIHSLNLHGHSIVDAGTGHNSFGASVFAGGSVTADVQLSSPGHWLLESSLATDTPLGAQEMFYVHPLVTQFFKQVADEFQQRDTEAATNGVNSVSGGTE